MLEMVALIQQCAPTVDVQTMSALVHVESNAHPYAIGVVDGHLAWQPTSHEEAVATANQLDQADWNFSVGLGQINRHYLAQQNIPYDQAFQPCTNLRLSSKILQDCYVRAKKTGSTSQKALHAALSCYYSGNFWRGFKSEGQGKPSYIHKVMAAADKVATAIPVVPSIETTHDVESVNKQRNLTTNNEVSIQQFDENTSPVLLPSLETKERSTSDKNHQMNVAQQPEKALVF